MQCSQNAFLKLSKAYVTINRLLLLNNDYHDFIHNIQKLWL